jgi:hypothetical protein
LDLAGLRSDLTGRILALAGVELRKSRFRDAEAFFLGRREFAHFHGEEALDIRLTRSRIRAKAKELESDPRAALRGGSDWLAFRFASEADADRALELVAEALEANR